MKITIDEINKTIEVESGTNLKELYDYLNERNIKFADYKLVFQTQINVINHIQPFVPFTPHTPIGTPTIDPYWIPTIIC